MHQQQQFAHCEERKSHSRSAHVYFSYQATRQPSRSSSTLTFKSKRAQLLVTQRVKTSKTPCSFAALSFYLLPSTRFIAAPSTHSHGDVMAEAAFTLENLDIELALSQERDHVMPPQSIPSCSGLHLTICLTIGTALTSNSTIKHCQSNNTMYYVKQRRRQTRGEHYESRYCRS